MKELLERPSIRLAPTALHVLVLLLHRSVHAAAEASSDQPAAFTGRHVKVAALDPAVLGTVLKHSAVHDRFSCVAVRPDKVVTLSVTAQSGLSSAA